MSNLFDAWLCGRTVRKHTMHVHRRENTAEHTWGMLLLLFKFLPQAGHLAQPITLHDAGEQGACDVPAHICWEMPELKQAVQQREDAHVASVMQGPHQYVPQQLTDEEQLVIEVLDRSEFLLSCWYEYQLGNRLVAPGIKRATERLATVLGQLPQHGQYHAPLSTLYTEVLRLTAEAQHRG